MKRPYFHLKQWPLTAALVLVAAGAPCLVRLFDRSGDKEGRRQSRANHLHLWVQRLLEPPLSQRLIRQPSIRVFKLLPDRPYQRTYDASIQSILTATSTYQKAEVEKGIRQWHVMLMCLGGSNRHGWAWH